MKTITTKALIARINRKLNRDGEVLRTLRGARWDGRSAIERRRKSPVA